MISAGIDDKPDRSAFALVPRYPPIVAAVDHVAALLRRGPVVAFADQDQSGNGHVALESKATRIERDGGTELVLRCLLDQALFDRRERQPAALRKTQHRDA